MRPSRIGFSAVAVGNYAAAVPSPVFRIGLSQRLTVAVPVAKKHAGPEVCAVCGETRDPAIGFCTGCGSRERTQVVDDQPDDPRIRLVRRVADTLAAEATLQPSGDPELTNGATLRDSRAIYAQLGSQRRLLRDRLLRASSPEERELYQRVLQQVEHVLSHPAWG
jgi:hypothetical protein